MNKLLLISFLLLSLGAVRAELPDEHQDSGISSVSTQQLAPSFFTVGLPSANSDHAIWFDINDEQVAGTVDDRSLINSCIANSQSKFEFYTCQLSPNRLTLKAIRAPPLSC